MPERPPDPDLAALSAALGGLTPAPPALNRDRLLFEAGRRAGRRRAWPLAACAFAALSAGLGLRLATVPAPAPVERVVYVPASRERQRPEDEKLVQPPVAHAPGSPDQTTVFAAIPRPAGADYLHLRDQVVRFGADSLPPPPAAAPPAPTPVERLLGLPPGSLNDDEKARWKTQLSRGDV